MNRRGISPTQALALLESKDDLLIPRAPSEKKDKYGFKELPARCRLRATLPCIPIVTTGATREGVAYNKSTVDVWAARCGWAYMTEKILMNVLEELEGDLESVNRLWDQYKGNLDKFREVAKNDMASLEATARKTASAAEKMGQAYAHVFAQLNGEEMKSAIENAERLANALHAISALQSQKLVFAVIDQESGSNEQKAAVWTNERR